MPIIKGRRKYSPDNILRQIWPIEIALSTDTPIPYEQKGGFFHFSQRSVKLAENPQEIDKRYQLKKLNVLPKLSY